MIAVIADDFTGAAEIAGICLRYGLKVELFTGEVSATDADVMIVSTDSRSLNKESAHEVTAVAIGQVLQLNPDWVYKKIDSVLRGYVMDELRLQMKLMQKKKAFILAANPSLGRTIKDGSYFIHDLPISETDFANDPEFPIRNAAIRAILNDDTVEVLKHTGFIPANGIIIGEAINDADVRGWADVMNEDILLAGSGDFFTALLEKQFRMKKYVGFDFQLPLLYVCGTAYDMSVNYIKRVHEQHHTVMFISRRMKEQSMVEDAWLKHATHVMQEKKRAIIAFNKELIPSGMLAADLRSIMAKAVEAVLAQNEIRELFIEGGSTATAILEQLSISHLLPVNEVKRGVVRMKAGSIYITVKPGSYELPNEIKELFGN